MPKLLTPEVREALESGRLAHLVTMNADGTPQVSVIWVGIEDDEVVSGHIPDVQKLRNVRRDPQVVLSMQTEGRNDFGLDHHIIVYGPARVTEGGAPELLQRLAHVYLGSDVKFPPFDNPPPGHVLRITPQRIGGVGPWGHM